MYISRLLCRSASADTNYHVGNHRFREEANNFRQLYRDASRNDKAVVAQELVDAWRAQEPKGRFLTKTDPSKGDDSTWHDVGLETAIKKAAKVLTERVPGEQPPTRPSAGGDGAGAVAARKRHGAGASSAAVRQRTAQPQPIPGVGTAGAATAGASYPPIPGMGMGHGATAYAIQQLQQEQQLQQQNEQLQMQVQQQQLLLLFQQQQHSASLRAQAGMGTPQGINSQRQGFDPHMQNILGALTGDGVLPTVVMHGGGMQHQTQSQQQYQPVAVGTPVMTGTSHSEPAQQQDLVHQQTLVQQQGSDDSPPTDMHEVVPTAASLSGVFQSSSSEKRSSSGGDTSSPSTDENSK